MAEVLSPSALPRARPASNGRRPPGRFTIQERRAGDSNAAPRDARPLSGRCLHPDRFTLHRGRRRTRIPDTSRRPDRFPARDRHLTASSSEEGGRLERHGRSDRALVSSEAQGPAWFALRSAPRTRTGNTPGLDRVALPIGLERHVHASGYRVSNPGPSPWQGDALNP